MMTASQIQTISGETNNVMLAVWLSGSMLLSAM